MAEVELVRTDKVLSGAGHANTGRGSRWDPVAPLISPGIDALDAPAPGRLLARREVVVVSTGERLERHEAGVRRSRAAAWMPSARPRRTSRCGPREPSRAPAGTASRSPRRLPRGPATVLDRGEGGDAPVRGREPDAGRTAPRSSVGGSIGSRPARGARPSGPARRPVGSERPNQPRERPAVGLGQRIAPARARAAAARSEAFGASAEPSSRPGLVRPPRRDRR